MCPSPRASPRDSRPYEPLGGRLHGPPAAVQGDPVALERDSFVDEPLALAMAGLARQGNAAGGVDDPMPGQAGFGG